MAFPNDWAGYSEATPISPSGNVTGFLMFASLSGMPSGWWGAVKSDGADIAVSDGNNNRFPCDLLSFHYAGHSGLLALNYTGVLSSSEKVRIWAGNSGSTGVPSTDSYGQYNTYSGLRMFYPSGSYNDRTINQAHLNMRRQSGLFSFTTGNFGVATGVIANVNGPIHSSLATQYNVFELIGYITGNSIPTGFPLVLQGHFKASTNTDNNSSMLSIGNSSNYRRLGFNGSLANDPVTMEVSPFNRAVTPHGFTTTEFYLGSARFLGNSGIQRQVFINGSGGVTGSANASAMTPNNLCVGFTDVAAGDNATMRGAVSLLQVHDVYRPDAWFKHSADMMNQHTFWQGWSWNTYTPPAAASTGSIYIINSNTSSQNLITLRGTRTIERNDGVYNGYQTITQVELSGQYAGRFDDYNYYPSD